MSEEIVNKVAASGLVTINLEDLYVQGERRVIDLAGWLYEGIVLREKDFRDAIKSHDWHQYNDALVAVHCTADAIVPTWAYMLITAALQPYARKIVFGDVTQLETELFNDKLATLDPAPYAGARVVIKGCSKVSVPVSAYMALTARLQPHVRSIMFGEPCSTVPVYKAK